MVLPEPYFSLSDSRDTSCAIRFFSEPVPQLRDSWDNTWCYRKPRRYRFPPCKASNLISNLYWNTSESMTAENWKWGKPKKKYYSVKSWFSKIMQHCFSMIINSNLRNCTANETVSKSMSYTQDCTNCTNQGCDLTKVKNHEKWVEGLGLPLV